MDLPGPFSSSGPRILSLGLNSKDDGLCASGFSIFQAQSHSVHPLCTQRKKVTALHPTPAFRCLSLGFPFADMNECRMSIKALES